MALKDKFIRSKLAGQVLRELHPACREPDGVAASGSEDGEQELMAKMQELQIQRSDDNGDASKMDPNDEEIVQMNQDLSNVRRDQSQLQERFKKVNIVNDQVSNWAKRTFMKLGTLTEDKDFEQEPLDLVTMFDSINKCVSRQLETLKEDDNEEGIDYGEVFTDFATPEFLDKNIRVRPVSGVTHGDETKDGR